MYREKMKQTQKTRRMPLPAAFCGICMLTTVFLGCSGFGFSGNPKVDLDQYVSLDAYGYDGYGSASIYIDWNRVAEDCGKDLRLKEAGKQYLRDTGYYSDSDETPGLTLLEEVIHAETDAGDDSDEIQNLSNGDRVSYTWSVDTDHLEDMLKADISYEGGTLEVTGLTQLREFDPFEDLQVTFEGISPYATADISYSGSTEGIYSDSFFCDASGALANGDQAEVKFDENLLDSLGREHGLVPSQMEKTYEVSGLDEYLESIDEIPDELFHEMDSTAQQAEYDFFSTRVDDFQLDSLDYIGGAMRMTKAGAEDSYRLQDSAGELSSNTAFLLYRGTVSGKAGTDQASSAPQTFYFSYMFGSVVKAGDGTVSFDSEKHGIRGGDTEFLAFGGNNSIPACEELMEFFIKYLFGSDVYEFSCTGELEGFNSAKFAGMLSDIPEEIKGHLQAMAVKRLENELVSSGLSCSNLRLEGEGLRYPDQLEPDVSIEAINTYYVMASADVSGWDKSERNGRRYFAVTFPGLMVSDSGSFYTMPADYISLFDSWSNHIYGYPSKEELYEAVKNAPGSYYVEYTYDIDDDIAADPKDISQSTETNAAEEETAKTVVSETEAPETEAVIMETAETGGTEVSVPEVSAPETSAPETAALETNASDAATMEMAQETEYISYRTMWATDDINVRETPTMDEDNIVYAICKGESVTVVGETPNWYKISIPYTDDNGESKEFIGFVSKQYISDSEPSGTAAQSETAASESTDEEADPADDAEKQADSGTDSTVQPADTEVPASVASFMDQESVTAGTETVPLKGKAFRWTASSEENAWEVMVYPDIEEDSEQYEYMKENGTVAAGKDAYVFLVEGGQAVSAVKMEAGEHGAVGYLDTGYYSQFYMGQSTENERGQRIFQFQEGKMVQMTDLSWSMDMMTGMFYESDISIGMCCRPRIDSKDVTLEEFVQACVKYRGYPKLTGKDSSDGSLVISFDPNGGEGETKFIFLSLEEGSIYLPECPFTKDGAEFAGWGLNPDDTHLIQAGTMEELETMQSYSEDGVVTWYAIWK